MGACASAPAGRSAGVLVSVQVPPHKVAGSKIGDAGSSRAGSPLGKAPAPQGHLWSSSTELKDLSALEPIVSPGARHLATMAEDGGSTSSAGDEVNSAVHPRLAPASPTSSASQLSVDLARSSVAGVSGASAPPTPQSTTDAVLSRSGSTEPGSAGTAGVTPARPPGAPLGTAPTKQGRTSSATPTDSGRPFKWISNTMWTAGAVCTSCGRTARSSRRLQCRSCGGALATSGGSTSPTRTTPLRTPPPTSRSAAARFETACQLKAMRLRPKNPTVARALSSTSEDSNILSPNAAAWKMSQAAVASPIDEDAFTPWFERVGAQSQRGLARTRTSSVGSAPGPLYAPSFDAMDSFYMRRDDDVEAFDLMGDDALWSPCNSITSVASGVSTVSDDLAGDGGDAGGARASGGAERDVSGELRTDVLGAVTGPRQNLSSG